MIASMQQLADGWDPQATKAVFRTDEAQEKTQGKSDYFLSSSDKVHFFAEDGVLRDDGSVDPAMPKIDALNKVGHALHAEVPAFKEYVLSEKVGGIMRTVGMQKPTVPQSMYIVKPPRVGGVVTSHQDSTFLYTEPRQSCVAVWLALHACNEQNGCIWARPGSHVEPVRRQFVRNEAHFSGADASAPMLVFKGGASASAPWEGTLPEPGDVAGLRAAGFVPCPCEPGDALVFPGTLDHLSLKNTSATRRHTFQLHLIDGVNKWSEKNWLQYPKGKEFMTI